jgi:hypothetical protein
MSLWIRDFQLSSDYIPLMYNFCMASELESIAKYFWDVDFSAISWEQHKNFIIRRILQSGDFQALRWLRSQLGDSALRDWILARNARGLSPRQIRYWSVVLSIDESLANQWVMQAQNTPWELRR